MGSMFESEVYAERNRIPWAEIDVEQCMREFTQYTTEVKLEVMPRPSVASRFWWTLKWTGEDGQEYCAQAQTLQLCLWRAAVREVKTRKRLGGPPTVLGGGA
jgi:hypothetical protein